MHFVNVTKDAASDRTLPASQKAKSKKAEKSEDEIAVDSLMTEIEDDLRGEELSKLWKQYGHLIIAVGIAVVIGVAGWQYWRQNVQAQKLEMTRQYETATKLITEGKLDEALTSYAAVAEKKGAGYAALAQLQKAAIALDKKDLPGAMAAYKALEADDKADVLFRDLATVLRALHGLDTENPLELEAALKPLLDSSNPFNASAVELTALVAAKQGDLPRAITLAESLLANPNTPAGVRQRAEELAAVFKAGPRVVVAPVVAPAPAVAPSPAAVPAATPSPAPQ
ncbi:MAG: tetratricopeptide repeat protein [Rhodospirillaceae bacterium]|nr:tetratricopeptide repeat protein [Rhodospirillaceae bacterium]